MSRAGLLPSLRPGKSCHSWRACLSSTSSGLGEGAASGALAENRGRRPSCPSGPWFWGVRTRDTGEGREVQRGQINMDSRLSS